jgi:hypothetical protein
MYQWIFYAILGQLVPISYCYMNLIIENIKKCKGSSQDIILLSSCLDEVLTDLAQIDVFS